MFNSENSFSVLYTTDVEKTATFFQKLGITPRKHEADKVVLEFGGFDLHYVLYTTEPAPAYQYITEPQKYGHGVLFYIKTDNIAIVAEKIRDAGGVLKTEVFTNHWNGQELLVEDPNGYKFAFYQKH